MKEEDSKEDPEKRGEEGEGRKPADRIVMNQLEPDKISDKCDDEGLIEDGQGDRGAHFINPLWLEDETQSE